LSDDEIAILQLLLALNRLTLVKVQLNNAQIVVYLKFYLL